MKYLVIILLSLFSLSVEAQQDTGQVCLPSGVAKQVAQDLIIGDSAKAMLNVVIDELDITKEKLSYKDSTILAGKLIEIQLRSQIRNEQEQKDKYASLYNSAAMKNATLELQNKTIKAKKATIEIVGLVIIGALTYLSLK